MVANERPTGGYPLGGKGDGKGGKTGKVPVVGEAVEVLRSDGTWSPGTVKAYEGAMVVVAGPFGEKQIPFPEVSQSLRPARPIFSGELAGYTVGQSIEVLRSDMVTWSEGKVKAISAGKDALILSLPNDIEKRVPAEQLHLLRPLKAASAEDAEKQAAEKRAAAKKAEKMAAVERAAAEQAAAGQAQASAEASNEVRRE